jgi:hypothetical protein
MNDDKKYYKCPDKIAINDTAKKHFNWRRGNAIDRRNKQPTLLIIEVC